MPTQETSESIIVIKKIKKSEGHHGGSWKVAFADFATAMMAFFLVMWLLSMSTPEELKYIAGYFDNPNEFEGLLASEGSKETILVIDSPDDAMSLVSKEDVRAIDIATLEDAVQQRRKLELDRFRNVIESEITSSTTYDKYGEQILFEITPEGLRINIIDDVKRPMFESGSVELTPYAEELISSIATPLIKITNKISIVGHTDASKFLSDEEYSNWELSSDRANAARRALISGGLGRDRILRIIGLADSMLIDSKNPENPINRRISITVMTKEAEEQFIERHKREDLNSTTFSTDEDENQFNVDDIGEILDKSDLIEKFTDKNEVDLDISDPSILEKANQELNQDVAPIEIEEDFNDVLDGLTEQKVEDQDIYKDSIITDEGFIEVPNNFDEIRDDLSNEFLNNIRGYSSEDIPTQGSPAEPSAPANNEPSPPIDENVNDFLDE